jgi:hypothetical protein
VPSITLTRTAQVPHNEGDLQGYRFTVVAVDGVGLPNEVFRMYQQPLDPLAQTRAAVFDGVVGYGELATLPINAPVPPAYHYRVAAIDVVYAAVETGEDQWLAIQADVQALVRSVTAAVTLDETETVNLSS